MTATLAAAVGAGSLVGFVLGLVGGGGSILAVPLLVYLAGVGNPHVAIGTSALAVSVNAFAAFAAHARKGHVQWRCAIVFALVGTVGALAGSTAGKAIDGEALLFAFGLLMVLVGLLMLRPRAIAADAVFKVTTRMCGKTASVALITGLASGFFGIGGGFLIVPGLVFATGMATITAVGSSLLAIGMFGLATALNYAASGLVDWPVASMFIAGGVFGSLAGMALGTALSGQKDILGRVFAVLVVAAGLYVTGERLISGG